MKKLWLGEHQRRCYQRRHRIRDSSVIGFGTAESWRYSSVVAWWKPNDFVVGIYQTSFALSGQHVAGPELLRRVHA